MENVGFRLGIGTIDGSKTRDNSEYEFTTSS